jgi:inhibitor of KinA
MCAVFVFPTFDTIVKQPSLHIHFLSESSVLLSWGNLIDLHKHQQVMCVQRQLNQAPFDGFVEAVPAYASLCIFFDPMVIAQTMAVAEIHGFVRQAIAQTIEGTKDIEPAPTTVVDIPVWYNGEDLPWMAVHCGLSIPEIVELHSSQTYIVFMNGFLPGFAYMGLVDERIAAPRKQNPSTKVPKGAVGIAGQQTGIYPFASPGGWQLIGQTPLHLFDSQKEQPCLLQPGYHVRFLPIDETRFNQLHEY